ncbi:hypothetical protein JCM8097_000747 [Rhodosporidiobolus ruineniae]
MAPSRASSAASNASLRTNDPRTAQLQRRELEKRRAWEIKEQSATPVPGGSGGGGGAGPARNGRSVSEDARDSARPYSFHPNDRSVFQRKKLRKNPNSYPSCKECQPPNAPRLEIKCLDCNKVKKPQYFSDYERQKPSGSTCNALEADDWYGYSSDEDLPNGDDSDNSDDADDLGGGGGPSSSRLKPAPPGPSKAFNATKPQAEPYSQPAAGVQEAASRANSSSSAGGKGKGREGERPFDAAKAYGVGLGAVGQSGYGAGGGMLETVWDGDEDDPDDWD